MSLCTAIPIATFLALKLVYGLSMVGSVNISLTIDDTSISAIGASGQTE